MSDPNKHLGSQPEEGATTLPGSFIGLYAELMKKGWHQSYDVSGEQNNKTGRGKRTVEVQRMILEKECPGASFGVKKIQIIMMLKDGKVECQMYTEPFISLLWKRSTKDMNHLSLFLQELDDYLESLNPVEKIEDIQADTRENMRRTQEIVRDAHGVFRAKK